MHTDCRLYPWRHVSMAFTAGHGRKNYLDGLCQWKNELMRMPLFSSSNVNVPTHLSSLIQKNLFLSPLSTKSSSRTKEGRGGQQISPKPLNKWKVKPSSWKRHQESYDTSFEMYKVTRYVGASTVTIKTIIGLIPPAHATRVNNKNESTLKSKQ
jgi:hypothetical protein